MLVTILEFALVLALSAFFVTWAKLEEEKVKTKEERDNYFAMLSLHNSTAKRACALDELNEYLFCEANKDYIRYRARNDALQDRLSSLLCPRNDHVWKDGRCAKCGRVKE